jgi:hypothetical protein
MTLCMVNIVHKETMSADFLVELQNQGRRFLPVWPQNWWHEFPDLGLKIGSCDLMICASKSPRRFLSLDLKTKWASVCRLRHKTDGGRSAQNTHRDLAACFT